MPGIRRLAGCHPEKKHFAKGLCRSCYKKQLVGRPAPCHPEKQHYGKGLCRPCYQRKGHLVIGPQKQRSRQKRLLIRLGLSEPEAVARLDKARACEICGGRNVGTFRVAIDHDHATNRFRGFLCNACNGALGLFRDDPALIARALAYLQRAQAMRA